MDAQIIADIRHCFTDALSLAGHAATYDDLAGPATSITAYVSDLEHTEMDNALTKAWVMEETDILVMVSEIASPVDGGLITIDGTAWRIRSHVLDKTGSGTCWIMRCTHDERRST